MLKKGFPVWAVAMLVMSLAGAPAFAQSSGSFAGDFVSTNIIRTITCAAGDIALECTNGNCVPGRDDQDAFGERQGSPDRWLVAS